MKVIKCSSCSNQVSVQDSVISVICADCERAYVADLKGRASLNTAQQTQLRNIERRIKRGHVSEPMPQKEL